MAGKNQYSGTKWDASTKKQLIATLEKNKKNNNPPFTNLEIAQELCISHQTLYEWKKTKKDFAEIINIEHTRRLNYDFSRVEGGQLNLAVAQFLFRFRHNLTETNNTIEPTENNIQSNQSKNVIELKVINSRDEITTKNND